MLVAKCLSIAETERKMKPRAILVIDNNFILAFCNKGLSLKFSHLAVSILDNEGIFQLESSIWHLAISIWQ